MTDRMQTQRAEFDAMAQLAEHYRRLTCTPIVDDDYPEVRHNYEGALATFLRAMKDNGRFEQGNRYALTAASTPTQREEDHSIPLHPKHNDGQEDAALDLLEAAKNTLYGIFKGDPHATHNAANMRNRIDVFLQGRQIDRLAARQQPLAATDWRVCRTCNGTGHQLHTSDAQCETCKGRGIEAAPKVATDTSGTEAHPEDFCELCNGRNIKPWFAPNEIWNQAVGEKYDILCPQCFVTLAEASGVVCTGWELRPEVLP